MKIIKQIFLVLVEVAFFTFILLSISQQIHQTQSNWELIERIILCYGLYQFFAYMILSNMNDSKKDMYLSVLTNYKLAQLYVETSEFRYLNVIEENIKYQLKDSIFNDEKIRNEYNVLLDLIDNRDFSQIQYKIIIYEHHIEFTSLLWRYSFFLRCIKI